MEQENKQREKTRMEKIQNKNVIIYTLTNGHRYTGRVLRITDEFVILESDRNGAIITLNLRDIQVIREVVP